MPPPSAGRFPSLPSHWGRSRHEHVPVSASLQYRLVPRQNGNTLKEAVALESRLILWDFPVTLLPTHRHAHAQSSQGSQALPSQPAWPPPSSAVPPPPRAISIEVSQHSIHTSSASRSQDYIQTNSQQEEETVRAAKAPAQSFQGYSSPLPTCYPLKMAEDCILHRLAK